MKKLNFLAGLLLGLGASAQAGDLVLNLGGASTYRIPLSSASSVVISPVTGDVTARPLSTAGTQGDGWCPAGDAVAIPVFVTPLSATVTQLPLGGGTTSLRWSVTGSPTPVCTTTGTNFPAGVTGLVGWNATMPSSSEGTSLSLSVSGTYTFQLNCGNGSGSVSRSVSVHVGYPDAPLCEHHGPPTGMTPMNYFVNTANTRAAGNQEWVAGTTLNTNRWFPDPISPPNSAGPTRSVLGRWGRVPGDTALIPFPSNQYLAFAFDTTGAPNDRMGSITWEQPGENAAPLFATISICPGDPNPSDLRCRSPYSGASGIGWTMGATPSSWCRLTPGETYYLNVFFRRPEQLDETDCTVGTCWWLMTQSCQQNCESDSLQR